jgi:hypothetical protein
LKQPGRKTAEAVALASFRGEPARLTPSPGLSEAERKLFCDLVLASSPGYFQELDRPLIDAYVRALVLLTESTKAIAAAPNTASAALLKTQAQAYTMVHGLAMRLRCSPQARAGHVNPASRLPHAAGSYYDRDALQDDDWNPSS